ncbi:DUF1624 domain-containing protein [candidate division WOR-3 bacterium]|nr:DUF1624 domain-containing protein [candidate division WOR-3 bacterium]
MKTRYYFLDMLRALAVAEMIHGHSLDGLLDTALRGTAFFVNWTFVRGYAAPVFLFAAGFAFAVVNGPRLEMPVKFDRVLLRRLQRLLFLIVLGYLLYLPYFSLRKTILSVGTAPWGDFLKTDILRCIGVSLVVLQLWCLLKPKWPAIWIMTGLAALMLAVLTPAVPHSAFVQNLPTAVKYYFTDAHFSVFCCSSFVFLGFTSGCLFSRQQDSWLKSSLVIAVMLIVFGRVVHGAGVLSGLHVFATKSGVIILLTVLLQRCEQLWQRSPLPVKYFGQESLVVYVVHLMIVYGSVLNKGMVFYWGTTLSYVEVYLFIGWLMAAMVVLAYVWHRLKVEHAGIAKWIKRTIYWSFLTLFLLKPH